MTTTKWNKIDRKQITSNYTHSWRLNSSLLNDEWVKEEIKKGWNISWNQMKMKTQNNRTFVTHWKQSQKGNYNSAYVHLKSVEIYTSSLNEKFPSGMTMFLLRVKDYLTKNANSRHEKSSFEVSGLSKWLPKHCYCYCLWLTPPQRQKLSSYCWRRHHAPQTHVPEARDLGLIWKPPLWGLAFIVPEGVMQASKGGKQVAPTQLQCLWATAMNSTITLRVQ